MNITTYKGYPKTLKEIKEKLITEIETCENAGQVFGVLKFNINYIDAVDYFESKRYEEVTDKMLKTYFNKRKKHEYRSVSR